jgi:hypothetical protein
MTTHAIEQFTTATTDAPLTAKRSPERFLRLVLSANAATSFAAGPLGTIAAGWCADTLGIASAGLVRAVSLALVVFAVDVALVARACAPRMRRFSGFVSCLDIAWVVATAVVVASGSLSGTGVAIAVVMGIGVADFAVLQLWFRRQMSH